MAQAEGHEAPHHARHGLRAHPLAKALLDEAAQVRQGPTRRLAFLRVGTAQDVVDQHRLLPLGQPLGPAPAGAVHQAREPLGVEAQNSVAQRLPLDPGGSRRVSPAHPVQGLGQRQHALGCPATRLLLGCGPGEWLLEKHGTRTRRSWKKLHIGMDADTGQIVASTLTDHDGEDGSQTGPLLDQVAGPVASFTGDGAYDQDRVYASVGERHPAAAVIVPPRATAVPSKLAESEPTQRDRHLQLIAERGRMTWQKASGYNNRARAETAIGRWKRVIGDGLGSHTDERRATEVNVAVYVLNRMLELGRPTYVRIA